MDTITFEQLQRYINTRFSYLSQGYHYENWSDEFCRKELNETFDHFDKALAKVTVPWETFTIDQMLQLGFCWWDESNTLLLIPLYLKNQFYTKGSEYDADCRFGCLAYGLKVKDGHVVLDSKASISDNSEPAVEKLAETPVDEKEEV
jgi:hypothetical protein